MAEGTAAPERRDGTVVSTLLTSTGESSDDVAPAQGAASTAADGAHGTAPAGPAHPTRGRAAQIVLREVDPDDDAVVTPATHDPAAVTTSLLAAFAARTDADVQATGVEPRTDSRRPITGEPSEGDVPSGTTGEAAPGTADDETSATGDDTTSGRDTVARDTTVDSGTNADDTAGDTDEIATEAATDDGAGDAAGDSDRAGETSTDTDEIAGEAAADGGGATDPTIGAGDAAGGGADRTVGRFANLPTVPIDVPDATGDAVGDPHDRTGAADPTPASRGADDPKDSTDDAEPAPPPSPTIDPWTTVAQVTLLCIGVLAVIQIVVLGIVSQFLTQSASGAGRDAADVLAAHGKVTTVMLPALVGGAIAAVALAAWRTRTATAPTPDEPSLLGRTALGVPLSLWLAAATTVAVLCVVLVGSSASIAAAQRTTVGAIATCVTLAAAFLAAPRSLAQPAAHDEAPKEDVPTDSPSSPGPLVGVG